VTLNESILKTNSVLAVWHSELMKPTARGQGLSVELAITIFGVMLSYWTGTPFWLTNLDEI
jgi:hypothetical protein